MTKESKKITHQHVYGKLVSGKFEHIEDNQRLREFLNANEGKLVYCDWYVVGEDSPTNRQQAYFSGYVVPAMEELMNNHKFRFPEVPKETRSTVRDYLKRKFIGEDSSGKALSTKMVGKEFFFSKLIEPIAAFAFQFFNVQLDLPTKDWRRKPQDRIISSSENSQEDAQ